MKKLIVVLAVLCPMACAAGLSNVDKTALQDSAKLNLFAYEHGDGAERALERGAYCSVASVLRRADASVPDGGISCSP